ncbi:hypothetical protein OS493_002987 [Desmophyllum pertusum]|uniref:Neurotransmitter-gated ion-channel ligand-binding domain-containing protein n=1 Tax=Desmophyllum pertusum TaxID=174260 RepID=A0A9W9YG94_9CNID|nr:hypothetical protein OS493_002987 [Desmophyllum pertusum]
MIVLLGGPGLLIIMVSFSSLSSAQAANPSAEQVLISTLMNSYNRNARPVLDRKSPTNVTFGLEVVQLVNVVSQPVDLMVSALHGLQIEERSWSLKLRAI